MQNKSSLIDSSWNNPKKYKDQLEFGYLNILNFYKENEKIIPKWIQSVVLYDLSWYFNILRGYNNFIKENNLLLTFLDLCKKIFSNIDHDLISNHRDKVIHSGIDLGILNLFYNEKTFRHHMNINKYDFERKYIRTYILSSSKDLPLEFFIKDKKLNIRTHKVKSIKLHDIDFYYKHIFYIDISDVNIDVKSNITTKINQMNTSLVWYTNWEKVSPNLQSIKTRFIPIAPKIKFIKLFKPKYLISYLSQLSYFKNKYKNSWILMDRDTNADDNAEHFYRYLKKNTEQNIYFVIRKSTKDFCRLKNEGFKVIPFGSLSHKLALLNCSYVISSHSEKYIHSFLKAKIFKNYIKYKFIFLQHGITKEDMSKWFNSEPIDVLITSTEKEYNSIVLNNKYELSKEEVIFTGFPRHDSLLKKEVINSKKTIVIMPTWRAYLTGKSKKNSNFRSFKKESLESLFVKKWFNLLSSEELKKVKEKNNLDIVFYPHLNMEAYTNHFKQIEGITYYDSSDELSIQDLFAKSDIFITDYSSVAFETAYLLKNILYYQFDTEEIFSGKHGRASGYFNYEQDGFGDVCVEEDELIQSIQKIINNKFIVEEKYLNRMENEFIYRDGKCSERIYNYLTKSE